jgi:3-dehydroquinate dehydratase II
MYNILVLHGPNLNLLGTRETNQYGTKSLYHIDESLKALAQEHKCNLETKQTNSESQFIDYIHAGINDKINFMIINAAAFCHTSIAIRDALLATKIPFIEVHITNVSSREAFRQHSYLTDISQGIISGLGPIGYELALTAIFSKLSKT